MARMDFYQAAKVLSKELTAKGYECRLDIKHPHPRLYIGSNGFEMFAALSRGSNYDEGNLLNIKRQDIARDIIPHLETPIENGPAISDNKEKETPKEETIEIHPKVFPIKAYITGKGVFTVNVPKSAVPEQAQCAQIEIFPSDPGETRIGLIFSPEHGVKASTPLKSKEPMYCYHFARNKVPFEYCRRQPATWRAPDLYARRINDSLICDKSLPKELLNTEDTVSITKLAKSSEKEEYSLQDGITLRQMINDWVAWASAAGHDPKLSVNDEHELCISVVTKAITDL